jgi:hypothetical protein
MNHIVFKIHGRGSVEFPLEEKINRLAEKFEKTNLFEFIGKSRIDGYNIYKLKEGIIRLGKIQKIKGINPTVLDKVQLILDENENDIQRITIFDEP